MKPPQIPGPRPRRATAVVVATPTPAPLPSEPNNALSTAPPPRIPEPTAFSHCCRHLPGKLQLNPAPALGLQTRLTLQQWRHGPVVRRISPPLVLPGPAFCFDFASSYSLLAADGRQLCELRDFPSHSRYPTQSAYLPLLIALTAHHVFPLAKTLGGAPYWRRCP